MRKKKEGNFIELIIVSFGAAISLDSGKQMNKQALFKPPTLVNKHRAFEPKRC